MFQSKTFEKSSLAVGSRSTPTPEHHDTGIMRPLPVFSTNPGILAQHVGKGGRSKSWVWESKPNMPRVSNADKVPHTHMQVSRKLLEERYSKVALSWIADYLTDRDQYCNICQICQRFHWVSVCCFILIWHVTTKTHFVRGHCESLCL